MQRINLSVDLEDNKIFSKAIDEAVKGVVKNKTRELFEGIAGEEIDRVAKARTEQWAKEKKGYYYGERKLMQRVQDAVDECVIKELDSLKVTQEMFDEAMERYMVKYLDGSRLKAYVNKAVTEATEKMISEKVSNSVSSKILDFLAMSLAGQHNKTEGD